MSVTQLEVMSVTLTSENGIYKVQGSLGGTIPTDADRTKMKNTKSGGILK